MFPFDDVIMDSENLVARMQFLPSLFGPMQLFKASYMGWGLLKLCSLISPLEKFSILQKYIFKFFESHSYLIGGTAAELRQHRPNMNVIFNR